MAENKKTMSAITAPHIRMLVDKTNELNISKQDIVSIIDRRDEVVLIYYR